MAYCTLADIEKYLDPDQVIDLSDDDNDDIPDTVVIDEAIAAGDADIDVYLSNRYTTPFIPPIPIIIRKLSARLAIHYLFLRRKEAVIPDKWDKDYDNLLDLLREIAKGDITLGVPSISTEVAIESTYDYDDAHFTFDKLGGF
jgi:phage gp36-like protein